jgi:hypothetical protein
MTVLQEAERAFQGELVGVAEGAQPGAQCEASIQGDTEDAEEPSVAEGHCADRPGGLPTARLPHTMAMAHLHG